MNYLVGSFRYSSRIFEALIQVILIVFAFILQNPNALDTKVLLDFDHVKKNLKIDDEGKQAVFLIFNELAFFKK